MSSYSIRDVSLAKQIDRARKDLDAIKSKQYVSRRGLVTKKTESTLIESVTTDIGVGGPLIREMTYIRITFKADTQLAPYGKLVLEFYDTAGNQLDTVSGIQVFDFLEYGSPANDGILEWNINVRASGSGSIGLNKFYTKLIVYGTDTGRFSWRPTVA